MAPTVWQRAHLWVNDWRSAPNVYLYPYASFGYRVVQIHLEDGGRVPWSYCEQLRGIGLKTFGCFWAEVDDPEQQAEWCVAEAKRLSLGGIVVNAENEIRDADVAGKRWSQRFVTRYRELAPLRGLALNTYTQAEGITMDPWIANNARLYLQTFSGGGPGFTQPVKEAVDRAMLWGWPKAKVKPCFGVYKPRPDPAAMIASAKEAGTVGFVAYYADGTFDEPDYMKQLAAGIGTFGIAR